MLCSSLVFFFFNDTATTEIYTLSLHDALPISVDRDLFAQKIPQALGGHPNIRTLREPVSEVPPDCLAIVATGPLTSDALAEHLKRLTNAPHLYFYDSISPIVDADSIDMSKVFKASRYNKCDAD